MIPCSFCTQLDPWDTRDLENETKMFRIFFRLKMQAHLSRKLSLTYFATWVLAVLAVFAAFSKRVLAVFAAALF